MKRAAALVILAGVLAAAATVVWRRPIGEREEPLPTQQIPPRRAVAFPAEPRIRVNVSPRGGGPIEIAIDAPYTVRSLKTGRVLARQKRLPAAKVIPTRGGVRIGRQTFSTAEVEIVPAKSPAIWVGRHQYRGRLRLLRRRGNAVLAVNVLPLEDYVASVINGETPATFPPEARKAQAIVARTYALYEIEHSRAAAYDVFADSRSQAYPGFQYRTGGGRRLAGENTTSRKLAKSTQGLVCLHRGRLFHTYYSAVCGGETLHGSEVFTDAGRPFACVDCTWCRPAKRYRWDVTVETATLSKTLAAWFKTKRKRFGRLRGIWKKPSASGRLPRYTVSDGRRRFELTGADLRKMLGSWRLPSTRFDVRLHGAKVSFRGRGHGHGVGLCQWGAAGLAKAGKSASAILRHYYRDIQIARFNTDNDQPTRTVSRSRVSAK